MITYLKGDATYPVGEGRRYIVHVCNNGGGWGAGFVLAISQRWSEPERDYRDWFYRKTHPRSGPFELGSVQFVSVQNPPYPENLGLWVVNMIAQDGYGNKPGIPLCYDALEKCLTKVAADVKVTGGSVHMPRIGCSLAGGRWTRVEPIIQRVMGDIDVFVYDLPGSSFNP